MHRFFYRTPNIPKKVLMVRRKCLDCPRLIARGSRCADCQSRYRGSFDRTTWPRLVKERDGYACVLCGSRDRVVADHIVPLGRGGSHDVANGQTLCHRHHAEKHGQRT
jgi:5-methylcytosine-specific restriction endonuclease McrA